MLMAICAHHQKSHGGMVTYIYIQYIYIYISCVYVYIHVLPNTKFRDVPPNFRAGLPHHDSSTLVLRGRKGSGGRHHPTQRM